MTGLDTDVRRPQPEITTLTAPFWAGTREGRLLLQRCTTCGQFVWTPQMACRSCLTETLEWSEVSGRGVVYTYVVMHRPATPAFKAPYVVAVIELDEGPRMLSDVVEIDPSAVRIGMPVEVSFEPAGDIGYYHFKPQAAAIGGGTR